MNTKTTKILYWVFTVIFALAMLADGAGGVSQQKEGQTAMQQLGYPLYILTILGIAKILGVIAILQNKFITIKEWAYAGFAFNFIGAFASRAFIGNGGLILILPLIMLAFMFISYFLWKRYSALKSTNQ